MMLLTVVLQEQRILLKAHRFLWVEQVMSAKSNTSHRVKFLLLPPMLLMVASFITWLLKQLIRSNLTVIEAQRLNVNLVTRSTLKAVQLVRLLIIILVW